MQKHPIIYMNMNMNMMNKNHKKKQNKDFAKQNKL